MPESECGSESAVDVSATPEPELELEQETVAEFMDESISVSESAESEPISEVSDIIEPAPAPAEDNEAVPDSVPGSAAPVFASSKYNANQVLDSLGINSNLESVVKEPEPLSSSPKFDSAKYSASAVLASLGIAAASAFDSDSDSVYDEFAEAEYTVEEKPESTIGAPKFDGAKYSSAAVLAALGIGTVAAAVSEDESGFDDESESVSEPVAESELVPEPVAESEPVPEPVAESEPVPEPVAESKSVSEPVAETESVSSSPKFDSEKYSASAILAALGIGTAAAAISDVESTSVSEPVAESELVPEPVAESEPVPEPVAESEPVPEPVAESKSVSEPVAETESVSSSPKFDSEKYSASAILAALGIGTAAAAISDVESTSVSEPVAESELVPEPVAESEPVPEPVVESEPVPEPVAESESVSEPVAETESVSEPVAESESVSEPVIEPASFSSSPKFDGTKYSSAAVLATLGIGTVAATVSEDESGFDDESESVSEPVVESESVSEPVVESESVLEPVVEPEPVPESVAEPEPVPESVAEPEPAPVSDSIPAPASAPAKPARKPRLHTCSECGREFRASEVMRCKKCGAIVCKECRPHHQCKK
ncbi:MAG TPA: hypothetical protein O0X70_01695 [Methanocorpusculum sp.]|nr:hypothetical protein [Methanocorpusculum sp.]